MLEKNKDFLSRVELSFTIFLKKWKEFVIPVYIFQLFFFVLLPLIFTQLFMNSVSIWEDSSLVDQKMSFYISLLMTMGLFFFLLYVTLIIPVQIHIINVAQKTINQKEVSIYDSILYAVWNVSNIFKTYWYIFAYTLLVPSIILIIWGFFIIWGQFSWSDNKSVLYSIGIWCVVIATMLWIFYWIYRWIKSSFAIYSALDAKDFTKENFMESLRLTRWNWWNIVVNIIWFWFILSLIQWLASKILKIFFPSSLDYSSFMSGNFKDPAQIQKIIESFTAFKFSAFILKILEMWISSIAMCLTTIFLYLLFLSYKHTIIQKDEVTIEV